MAETLHRVVWWQADEDVEECAVEVERSDEDEVAVHIRGLSGGEDPGSIYLSLSVARRMASELVKAYQATEW